MISNIRAYLIALLLIIFHTELSCETFQVCSECSYKSISSALEAAKKGDSILVAKGVYREGNIIIEKTISLIGEDKPVIDGEFNSEIITIKADHVHLEGFEIANVGTHYLEDRAGIRVVNARHFRIIDNFLSNTFFGIYLQASDYGELRDNVILGDAANELSSGNAIHLWNCNRILIHGNHVSGHRDGIYLEFVNESSISNNRSEENLRYGLHFMFSNDNVYSHNIFRKNGAGVAVMFSRRINMKNNLFENNWGEASYGLLLKEIFDAEITENEFSGNTIAIFVEGSNRINYTLNTFSRNGWGIKMAGGCLDNIIEGNNFISNNFDLAAQSTSNNNRFDGNYWSSYSGYDLDNDGVGDIPYRPLKMFGYVVARNPEAILLLRSFFISMLDLVEQINPKVSPLGVMDNEPSMHPF